jgi:23S rRNA (cytosine1962-C5)-methyltransferase
MRRSRITIRPEAAKASDARIAKSKKSGATTTRPKKGSSDKIALQSPSSRPDNPTTLTRVEVVEGLTLVRCSTTVGSTHALRAQLRGEGMRLLGDRLREYRPEPDHLRRGKKSSKKVAPVRGGSIRSRAARAGSPTNVAEETCLHLRKISFVDPQHRTRITASARPAPHFKAGMKGEPDIRRALSAALVRRLPCLVNAETDSWRLLTGSREDAPGLVADKFGPVVLLQVREETEQLRGALRAVANWYAKNLRVTAVYAKRFGKDQPDSTVGGSSPAHVSELLVGQETPDEIPIRENGLTFGIWPHDGLSPGLFLDQRDNRSRVRSMAKGADILNLFSYTCAFSVAAAAGQAQSTTSVDISPKQLERGRTNFALNGLSLDHHRFIRSSAVDYCARASRQGKSYDLIIIDPPTFARGRRGAGTFSVTEDLNHLIDQAAQLLRPGGTIMVSTNHRRISSVNLREMVHASGKQGRLEITATPSLPLDFAPDPQHAKTVIARKH